MKACLGSSGGIDKWDYDLARKGEISKGLEGGDNT